MGGGILNEPPGDRKLFRFRLFRTKLPFFVLFWLWDIKRKPQLGMGEAGNEAKTKNQ